MSTILSSVPARYLARAIALSALMVSVPARGDEAGDTATARALGVDGITLADGGKCKEAVEKLERAEKLHHAPTTAVWLAECEIELGKLVVGTERLQRIVHEPLSAGAPPAFAAAALRAQKRLDEVLPRIPTLRIAVSAPVGTKLVLTIDGEPVPDATLDTARPVDPGKHTVQVTARGFLASSVTTSLVEGQARSVSLELRPDPNARRAAVAVPAERPAGGSLWKAPTVIAFGLGALGLGAGIASGAAAAGRSAALESACDANKVCPTSMQSDIAAGKRWSTISTVSFIGAGVAVATGIVLLLSTSGGTSERRPDVAVRPVVGAGYAGLDGAF